MKNERMNKLMFWQKENASNTNERATETSRFNQCEEKHYERHGRLETDKKTKYKKKKNKKMENNTTE